MSELIVGIIGIAAFFFVWAVPPISDLHNGTIVQSDALYSRKETNGYLRSITVGGDIFVTINEDTISVVLFPGFLEDDFPKGTYHGIVWYGKKSKVLLKVALIDGIDQCGVS